MLEEFEFNPSIVLTPADRSAHMGNLDAAAARRGGWLDEELRKMITEEPRFRDFYPRNYKQIHGWYNAKSASIDHLMNLIAVEGSTRLNRFDKTAVQGAASACRLSELKMPTYWMGDDLLEALLRTLPPDNLYPGAMAMPLPAFQLMLPEKRWLDTEGAWLCWMSICVIEKGWGFKREGWLHYEPAKEKMFAVSAISSTGTLWTAYMPESKNLGVFSEAELVNSFFTLGPGATESKGDADFTRKLMLLAVNVVMYLMTRQQKEQPLADNVGGLERKAKPQKNQSELWAPSWIGKEYKIRRAGPAQGGTHASPHTHWRFGHIRNTPYGPMDVIPRPTRVVMIEPVLVNAAK